MDISPCAALSRDDKEEWSLEMTNKVLTFNKSIIMTKRETFKFIIQIIASVATAIVTALGATSCMAM